ncbi:MAG TPA: hypothetical protein VMW83_06150 [Spirochaetia bacterium]|nr:hypothetical protein [Spirochaetia bacterium]
MPVIVTLKTSLWPGAEEGDNFMGIVVRIKGVTPVGVLRPGRMTVSFDNARMGFSPLGRVVRRGVGTGANVQRK